MKISPSKVRNFFLAFAMLLWLGGCNGTSNSGKTENFVKYNQNRLYTGTFVDAPVKGLKYQTNTQSGYTDERGHFHYKENEYISFYMGNLYLGRVQARKLITPYTLGGGSPKSPTNQTVNIAILLQNCDKDTRNDYIDVDDFKNYQFSNVINLNDPSDDFINELENEGVSVTIDKESALKNLNNSLGFEAGFTIPPISNEQKKEFLDAVNEARAHEQDCGEYGVKPAVGALTWSDKLYKAAYTYNYDMVHGNAWHHVGSNTQSDIVAKAEHLDGGSHMRDRIEYYNYDFYYIGENIAKGYKTLHDVIAGWIDSDGHCRNLMDAHFTQLGMSLLESDNTEDKYGKYWTQDFGQEKH